jgi:hypothetical protein
MPQLRQQQEPSVRPRVGCLARCGEDGLIGVGGLRQGVDGLLRVVLDLMKIPTPDTSKSNASTRKGGSNSGTTWVEEVSDVSGVSLELTSILGTNC